MSDSVRMFSRHELAAAVSELSDEIVTFRPKQEECLQAILKYRQTFLNMATNGGKTAVIQTYPILISNRKTEPCFSLVVQPLRSIIVQQASPDPNATCVYMEEKTSLVDLKKILASTTLRCLYCCPESFDRKIKDLMSAILSSEKLCLIAVDEAHMITVVDSSFRKDFLGMLPLFPRHIKQLYLSGNIIKCP
jgi:superfamily II DNA helicase RecQ